MTPCFLWRSVRCLPRPDFDPREQDRGPPGRSVESTNPKSGSGQILEKAHRRENIALDHERNRGWRWHWPVHRNRLEAPSDRRLAAWQQDLREWGAFQPRLFDLQ